MGHPPIIPTENRAHMEENPNRRPVLPVIQQGKLQRPLLSDRLPDLANGSPVGVGSLEDPPVPTKNLFLGVPGHFQEPAAGVDDRVAGYCRVGDQEVVGQLVESVADPGRVAGTQRVLDRSD